MVGESITVVISVVPLLGVMGFNPEFKETPLLRDEWRASLKVFRI
jgi:hypothetical protein